MARRLRVDIAGCLYHVVARGNERKAVFGDDQDRDKYLSLLARYRIRFEFELLAYCLMANHLHLAIGRGSTPLSRVMLALQTAYTQYFNRRWGRVGHLFQGRYKAFLVDSDSYFGALLRYIHRNPVEAGLIDVPERYRWSSDRYYRRGANHEGLAVDAGLSRLASQRDDAVTLYRELMAADPGEPYEAVPGVAQVFKGDEDFARRVIRGQPERELVRRSISVGSVAEEVARARGLTLSLLRGAGRTREASLARAIVAYLAKSVGRIPYVRTAEFLNRDGSTLTRDIHNLETRILESRSLKAEVDRLAERLTE
jgi:putative transposase